MNTNRDDFIKFRLSENERQALQIMATSEGRNLSEMMRECVRREAERQGIRAVGLVHIPQDLTQLQPA